MYNRVCYNLDVTTVDDCELGVYRTPSAIKEKLNSHACDINMHVEFLKIQMQ